MYLYILSTTNAAKQHGSTSINSNKTKLYNDLLKKTPSSSKGSYGNQNEQLTVCRSLFGLIISLDSYPQVHIKLYETGVHYSFIEDQLNVSWKRTFALNTITNLTCTINLNQNRVHSK